jgi:hypothetical protein
MTWKGGQMAKSVPKKDLVSFKEILLANSIQVDALAQLLIEIYESSVLAVTLNRMNGFGDGVNICSV